MVQDHIKDEKEIKQKVKRLKKWARLLTVFFRIIIVFGLMLFFSAVALIIFVSIIPGWVLILPLSVIGFGIIIARIEYALHKRVVALAQDENNEETAKKKGTST